MRVFKNAWFDKFARKVRIDDAALREAVSRAELGMIDADLGAGLIKQRVARPGAGRSTGFRTLILFRTGTRAVFVYGFAKSDRANLSSVEEAVFKRAAKLVLEFDDRQIDAEVANGRLSEIAYHAKDIQK